MANRKQTVQVGGENTGEITQSSDEPAEQVVEAQQEATPSPYTEEQRQEDLETVSDVSLVFEQFDKENAPKEEVLPPVTRHTLFEEKPELKALAERFQHLSETEILHMARANSWDNETRLEVTRNNRNESRDIMHPPVATAQEIVLLDNGDNS